MENLEEQIINRLNNHIEKYGFCIKSTDTDAHLFGTYGFMFNWGLFLSSSEFSTDDRIVHLWKTSNDMLLSKKYNVFKYVKYSRYNEVCDIRCCISDSLEELVIKMDLMGI
jgi:hypothetical protein